METEVKILSEKDGVALGIEYKGRKYIDAEIIIKEIAELRKFHDEMTDKYFKPKEQKMT